MVGAGIAGVVCAEILHNAGHEVEIFEMAPMNSPTRPRQMEGSVNFFENVPELKTDRRMRRLEIHSPNAKVSFEGDLGFFYEVGGKNGIEANARKSIEKQLPIHYSTRVTSKEQLERFNVAVAADGYRSTLAREAGLRPESPKRIGVGVGFTIEGDFDNEWMRIWFDNHFSSRGYAYVIPFSRHEASLVSASIGKAIKPEIYRERLKKTASSEGWQITDKWVDFESWYDFSQYRRDNLYVIGNAGSFTEPAFGFGLKWAIKSARLCGRAINSNLDYDYLIERDLKPEYDSWVVMRRFFETAENDDYDTFVKSFDNPSARNLAESGKSILRNADTILQQMMTGS